MSDSAIVVRDLKKSFGSVQAVRGVSFDVQRGTVFGLLGPNGAGKTTVIRMLTTLMQPDEGTAKIEGYDVIKDAHAVRTVIGLAGQYAAVDETLTGRENLVMVGRLYHMGIKAATARADELLWEFGLEDAGDRTLQTYSGGMRRRLDLAASLVNRPSVLFLDEPTTGLDPQSRIALWKIIHDLVSRGTTVLLTTQYLDEADYLANHIVIIDQGRVIESGTPEELKARVGNDVLEVRIKNISQINAATSALRSLGAGNVRVDLMLNQLSMPLENGMGVVPKAIRALDIAHVEIDDLTLRHPTLDEAFLSLTGHSPRI